MSVAGNALVERRRHLVSERNYPDPKQWMEWDEDDPRFQVRILGMRVDALTKEKEAIEEMLREERIERKAIDLRVASMEKTFQRGAGMMIIIPVLGAIFGTLVAYGKFIFGPWFKP